MKHSVSHGLEQALANQAVRCALDSYAERFAEFEPNVTWLSDSQARIGFVVRGMSLNGAVEVGAETVGLDLEVPFLLRVFKKKAIEVIEREIRLWVDKASRGELDGD